MAQELDFFPKQQFFSTMAQDLEFFEKFFLTMGQDLARFFLTTILHYGLGLREFFFHKISPPYMAQDLEIFSQTIILHYGSGLRFFF